MPTIPGTLDDLRRLVGDDVLSRSVIGAPPGVPSNAGQTVGPAKRKHKYGAQATTVDGIRFASKREAKRWGELRALEHAGKIHELQRQVPLELHAPGDNRTKIGKYVADFRYWERGEWIYEDSKGVRTPLYKWKKKHAEAEYGIVIREV